MCARSGRRLVCHCPSAFPFAPCLHFSPSPFPLPASVGRRRCGAAVGLPPSSSRRTVADLAALVLLPCSARPCPAPCAGSALASLGRRRRGACAANSLRSPAAPAPLPRRPRSARAYPFPPPFCLTRPHSVLSMAAYAPPWGLRSTPLLTYPPAVTCWHTPLLREALGMIDLA